MTRYVITEAARRDLRQIWTQLADDSVVTADRVIDRLERAISLVGESPNLGHWREDVADKRHPFSPSSPMWSYTIALQVRSRFSG